MSLPDIHDHGKPPSDGNGEGSVETPIPTQDGPGVVAPAPRQSDVSDRTTTQIHNIHVTTASQNGALLPSSNGDSNGIGSSNTIGIITSNDDGVPQDPDPPIRSSASTPALASATHTSIPARPVTTTNNTPSNTPTNTASLPIRITRGRTAAAPRTFSGGSSATSASPARSTASATPHPNRIGRLGVCALDAKARSKPSRNILNRLLGRDGNDFDVLIFGDKIILDESVKNWPVVDFLISFYSEGFPLLKAIEYVSLRKPFCVNDLPMQTILWDRRICLHILDVLHIPTPPRLEVNRDGGPTILSTEIAQRLYQLTGVRLAGSEDGRGGGEAPPTEVRMEDDNDTLIVDGKRLSKPFVEKPTCGEDHNINLYYPRSQDGGGRRLFRKINNKSSEKDDNLIVPRAVTDPTSSYIYEQFLKVENAEDVKAYTVGPDFCHAETRKSPVVDGLVKRNPNGKEIRYITSLSKEEQLIATKISQAFGQRVCGFDLLRVEERSYVIDVNGWSFVKDNNEYYDKCASILKSLFVRERMRRDGRLTPSDGEEGRESAVVTPDHPSIFMSLGDKIGERENAATWTSSGTHRDGLNSVFRSRSISQLRDSVTNVAARLGHPATGMRSSSGTTSPHTSSPNFDRPSFEQQIASGKRTPVAHSTGAPDNLHSLVLDRLRGNDTATNSTSSGISRSTSADALPNLTATADVDGENATFFPPPAAIPAPASKSQWKLKGMVAVIRHADRTPKQKFKFTFHTQPFINLLKGHREEVLLAGEAALASVEQAVRQAMSEGLEDRAKLALLWSALQKKRDLPGTKVQIKPLFKRPKGEKGEEKVVKGNRDAAADVSKVQRDSNEAPPALVDDPIADAKWGTTAARTITRSDSIGEVTKSRAAAADHNLELDKLQLVMKWGGEPTHSARYQASDLGENMRNDMLLMNRDVLSDVSIFSSSERRVTTSAQIFAAAFLDDENSDQQHREKLVNDAPRIQIRKDLLDDSNAAKDEMDKVKKKLKGLLRKGLKAPEQFAWPEGAPEPYVVVRQVVELMKFHRRVMKESFTKLQPTSAVESLTKIMNSPALRATSLAGADGEAASQSVAATTQTASAVQGRWCTGEDADLFRERWEKLFDEFTDAEKVDPSKISELYDSMKFDALHNRQFLEWVFTPSRAILAEELEAVQHRLNRTESQTAREAFESTHLGTEPVVQENDPPMLSEIATDGVDETEPTALQLPPSAGTSRLTPNSPEKSPAGRERSSLSQRMEKLGLRKKSVDLMATAKTATPTVSASDAESYFKLYRGDANAPSSKAKKDVRLEKLTELYGLSKILFDYIGPQEYGISNSEKLEIGLLTSLPLLKEIVTDLEEVQASDAAKSFIYFTKESHIYTLLNCILEGGVPTKIARPSIPELDYLSQICFELYESENAAADLDPHDPLREAFNYSIRISISPGCHTFDPLDVQLDSKHCIGCAPRRTLTPHAQWKTVLETLRAKFHTVKLPTSFTAVNLSEKVSADFEGESGAAEVKEGGREGEEAGQEVSVLA